jgi:SAM-dependent methyltransferase
MDVDDDILDFDEAYYLASNPDVAREVAAGGFETGYHHYVAYGRAEGRHPRAHRAAAPSADDYRDRVGSRWSEAPEVAASGYWMAHPMVRERLNHLASGDPGCDSYGHLEKRLRGLGFELPIRRAVSIGCGFGALERDLASRGIIAEVDAYDIAPAAIEGARRLAAESGHTGLRYHVLNLETERSLPTAVDIVFAHQSVHHIERLDELFATVATMLRPGGIFHLHEFVGPERFQWTDTQIDGVNRFLSALSPRHRALTSGLPKTLQTRPTVEAMIAADPSEAIRSKDILPALGRHFDIVEVNRLGGALLHLGLADIVQNFDPGNAEDRAVLEAFFQAEDEAMRAGTIDSDFVVVTAVKRAE